MADSFNGPPLTETHVMGYPILGRSVVEVAAAQHEILAHLYQGFRENDSVAAACFNPRHAIVAQKDGEQVILLICFECLQWKGSGPGGSLDGLLAESPKAAFNKIWADHGLTLAK